jgi:hypothetical protein
MGAFSFPRDYPYLMSGDNSIGAENAPMNGAAT